MRPLVSIAEGRPAALILKFSLPLLAGNGYAYLGAVGAIPMTVISAVFIVLKLKITALKPSVVLYRLMPCYTLLSVVFTFNSALRGAGEFFRPFFGFLCSFLLVRLPAAYLLDFFGRSEIGWCYGIDRVMGLGIAEPYYLSGKWKRRLAVPGG